MFCSTMVNRLSSILVMGAMAFSACLIPVSSADACDVAAIAGKTTNADGETVNWFNDGAPAIFKNRDESANWHQEIKNFPAAEANSTIPWQPVGGAYTLVYNDNNHVASTTTTGDTTNPSAGVNEKGFAIAVSSVYEDYTNPKNEIENCNTLLLKAALQYCATLADFELLIKEFHKNTAEYFGIQNNFTISGNFVALDAEGNVALYELYTGLGGREPGLSNWSKLKGDGHPIKFRKIDVNTGQISERVVKYEKSDAFGWNYHIVEGEDKVVTYEWSQIETTDLGELVTYSYQDAGTGDLFLKLKLADPNDPPKAFPGYVHRTNNNSYINRNGGVERNVRLGEIFAELTEKDADGNYLAALTYENLIFDVAMNVVGEQESMDADAAHYSSTFCISRSATRSGVVINGVPNPTLAAQTTMWAALGEPSATVFMPFWAGTAVNPLVYKDGIDISLDADGNPIYYDWSDTCMINREANRREILDGQLYESNGGSTIWGPDDYTINKIVLEAIQAKTHPVQDDFIARVNAGIGGNLADLSWDMVQDLYDAYLADEFVID